MQPRATDPLDHPDLATVRNVVFDVGQVLINLCYHELLARLHERGLSYQSRDELLERMDLYRYERGEISNDAFLATVNAMLCRPMEIDELRQLWLQVFFPVPPMIELAHQFSRTHRVYLLSNVGRLHWEYLIEQYRLDRIGHGQLASFQVGSRKPDASIYRAAEHRFDLDPAHTVFIDDIVENAEGARACGWRAIHHQSVAETRRRLCELCGLPASP